MCRTDLFKYVKSFLKDSNGVRQLKVNNKIILDAENHGEEFGLIFPICLLARYYRKKESNSNKDYTCLLYTSRCV